jgi:hypothetical protein
MDPRNVINAELMNFGYFYDLRREAVKKFVI